MIPVFGYKNHLKATCDAFLRASGVIVIDPFLVGALRVSEITGPVAD
jgi:hypothetical protein